jgi:hypothetical protein
MPVETREPYAGMLTPADPDRTTNTGRIHHLHRATVAQCPPCHGQCQQGRACNADTSAEACAPEGGQHADPVPSGTARRAGPAVGIALVLLPWLAGVAGWALYVRWAA